MQSIIIKRERRAPWELNRLHWQLTIPTHQKFKYFSLSQINWTPSNGLRNYLNVGYKWAHVPIVLHAKLFIGSEDVSALILFFIHRFNSLRSSIAIRLPRAFANICLIWFLDWRKIVPFSSILHLSIWNIKPPHPMYGELSSVWTISTYTYRQHVDSKEFQEIEFNMNIEWNKRNEFHADCSLDRRLLSRVATDEN